MWRRFLVNVRWIQIGFRKLWCCAQVFYQTFTRKSILWSKMSRKHVLEALFWMFFIDFCVVCVCMTQHDNLSKSLSISIYLIDLCSKKVVILLISDHIWIRICSEDLWDKTSSEMLKMKLLYVGHNKLIFSNGDLCMME